MATPHSHNQWANRRAELIAALGSNVDLMKAASREIPITILLREDGSLHIHCII